MRWTKLKNLVESRFTASLKGRVTINSTAYGNCSCGHAWMTLDKEIIANFCTRAFWSRAKHENSGMQYKKNRWISNAPIPAYINDTQSKKYGDMEYGELSRQDVYQSCWEFVHDLNIGDALNSDDPLIQTLAVLDSRVGKRRLNNLESQNFHPLAKRMLALRLNTEAVDNGT